MTDTIAFDQPLRVQAGAPNTVRTIASVNDACAVLIDWSYARRGPFYQEAREVVEAAMAGKAEPAMAREAFAALAAHAGILVDSRSASGAEAPSDTE